MARQLKDSSYIVIGDDGNRNVKPYGTGWAGHISKSGIIMWNRMYYSDTFNYCYLRDALQKPDGSLLFVGQAFNDTLPSWHVSRDVWLVGADTNGCNVAGCSGVDTTDTVTGVPILNAAETGMRVWPNPSSGTVNVQLQGVALDGELQLTDMQGRILQQWTITKQTAQVELPPQLVPGVYLCRYVSPQHNNPTGVVRLVYQP